MSGLYLWAPRLLFMWQLLWLLVHAAPVQFPKLALDPVLLTSISPEENGPSPNPQEISAQEPEAPEIGEPYSIEEEALTQPAISPKLLKSLFVNGVQEELPTTPENSDSSIEQKSSSLLQFPLASAEPSPFRQKGPAQRPKNSIYLKMTVSPLGSGRVRYPMLPYVTLPPKNIKLLATAKEFTAYFAKFPEAVEPPSQEEVPPKLSEATKSSSSRPTSEADATALQLTIAPPEHLQETLPHQEPVQAQQPTWSEITGWPLNLELTVKPEAAVEGEHPTALKLTIAPPEHPQVTLPHPEPVQAQQPPWSEITGRPLDLGLTIKPEAAGEGEHLTLKKQAIPPPEHPQVTLPHPEPVQAQQPPWSEITGRPLDLGLTIKPEAAGEGEHPTLKKQAIPPPEHPQVTLPHPEPVQAQQQPWSEITGRPLDLGLTIKPEAAGEGEHPTLKKQAISPPEHPQVTLPHPEPVQAQQPPWSEITGRPLDLGLTIKPEAAGEGEHPTLKKQAIPPPEHPQVTLPHPEPVQAQQQPWSEITGRPLDLELTIKPEAAGEGEHPTLKKQAIPPPEHPQVTLPHPEPVQAQQPPWSEITGRPLDLELTIKPEAAGEGEHPTLKKQAIPPPEHPQVTLPHPEPVQAQQPPWSEITGRPLDLELTIKPEAAGEGEHPTLKKQAIPPPEHPQVTLPHPEPVQAQQPPWSEITGRPLDLELTIKPEAAGEGEHPTLKKQAIPPPEHPQVTLPHPEPVQAQQPPWSEITGRPLDLELTIKPEAAGEGEHPTTLQQTIPPPEHPQVTLPHPEPVQAQQPPWSEITGRPLDLELTIKPEAAGKGEHPTTLQQTTAPPEHPQVTFPHPEPVQAQQSTRSETRGQPFNLELTIKPEAAGKGEHPTALQQTTAPPEHPQVTFPHPEPVQAQQSTRSETRGQPFNLELTIKPEAAGKGEHPTTLQQTIPPPEHPQVTLPHPEPVQAQQPPWSEITGQPFKLELTIKPEAAGKGEHPTALQQTTPPLEHPQVILPNPETVSTQYSAWTEMISPISDEQFFRMQHPMSSEPGPPTAEQNAVMNICELCTCNNETLSCTGFGPKQKLHRVPVPQPNTYKGTFTTLNLKGNSISQFDKDIWKSYHKTEKLILSDNNLKELRKESFESLLFLKYLDLSGNNIKFIEESTFETLPFLEYLNLGGNLITEVSSGMFRAWHGMQFLHTLILHHNPLKTIEDFYLFKLPALQYLDLGTTQVSLTTVEKILTMSTKLEKLILPHHLACCLCQVKNMIETISHTVRLHCDTECLTKTRCVEEEPHLTNEEGSFLKVLQDRKNTSAVLMIEPERTSSDKNNNNLSAFMNLLTKLLNEQEAKVSKPEWDVKQWENEKTEAPDEEEEEEALGSSSEVPGPGYVYKNKVLVATPVIAVATGFTIIVCLILICGRVAHKKNKEGKPRGFFSNVLNKRRSQDRRIEMGSFWNKLKGKFGTSKAVPQRSETQALREKDSSDENDPLDQMEKGEGSTSTARTVSLVYTTTE